MIEILNSPCLGPLMIRYYVLLREIADSLQNSCFERAREIGHGLPYSEKELVSACLDVRMLCYAVLAISLFVPVVLFMDDGEFLGFQSKEPFMAFLIP